MPEEIACAHIWVSGRVQGVFFRAHTQDVAEGLKLDGWVKNLYDGRVEIIAQGPKQKVEQLIKWCHKGPPFSKVTNVKVNWEEPKEGLKGFNVTY
jgi:acylphosphatase